MAKKTKELLQEILLVQKQILRALERTTAKKTNPAIIVPGKNTGVLKIKRKKKKKD